MRPGISPADAVSLFPILAGIAEAIWHRSKRVICVHINERCNRRQRQTERGAFTLMHGLLGDVLHVVLNI